MADPKHPERPTDYTKIANTIERRAHLIVDMLEDRAQHIVDQMDEPPPGTEEPDAATVRAMWTFSPYGDKAPAVFWMLHDLTLERLLADVAAQQLQGDDQLKAIRGAQQKAEATTLARVYPHRGPLMMLGFTTPERSIELAKKAARLVEQDQKREKPGEREARIEDRGEPQPESEALTYAANA